MSAGLSSSFATPSAAWSSSLVAASLLGIFVAGCAAGAREASLAAPPSSVRQTQDVARELGFEPTPNFEQSGPEEFEHCYYTRILDLPADYSGLWFKRGRNGRCRIDRGKYDVLYYAPEALAGTETAATPALEQASETRRTFVVAHEDFHDQPGVREMPAALKEAAATLAGLLVEWERSRPADEAREALPASAAVAFLAKARLTNRSHARLSELIARYRSGAVSRQEALAGKREIFAQLAEACGERPAIQSFAGCPAAFNSAGLAFEATYTRLYPDVFAVYEACNWDVRHTLAALLHDLPALAAVEAEPRTAALRLVRSLQSAAGDGGSATRGETALDRLK